MLMMILWLILITLGIIALVKWIRATMNKKTDQDSALAILRNRYARGEISKEEFEEQKNNLHQQN